MPPRPESTPVSAVEDAYRARAEFGSTCTLADLWTPPDESLSDWRAILIRYGLSVDGYAYALAVLGKSCAEVADEVWEHRRSDGHFTSTFAELRCALFFLQRCVRNNEQSPGWRPDEKLISDVTDLYAAIVRAWHAEGASGIAHPEPRR